MTRNLDFRFWILDLRKNGFAFLFFLNLLFLPLAFAAQTVDLEEQVRRIAAELRCPVCQNLSAADSPSELAQQMRGVILEQLKEGKTPEQIKAYFVSKYGEWVLLAPTPKGFSLLVWVLPFVAVGAGIIFVLFVVRRWVHKKNRLQLATVEPALIERVQREVAAGKPLQVELEAEDLQSPLLQEKARLYADLKELEFDYKAGKLSSTDYQELCRDLEAQAAAVLKELGSSAPARPVVQRSAPKTQQAATHKEAPEREKATYRGWRLAAGGVFLLLFGITLGVFLTKSLRPRLSDQDNITGDFLTGTGPGGIGTSSGMAGMEMGASLSKDIASLLAQGRSAFERQEWPAAIQAFRKILEADANHVEANSYMGLVLAQAGHVDEALAAFDRALATDPNFPIALWGKGLLLYRAKKDTAHARELFERLVGLMPAGEERKAVQKILGEMTTGADGGKKTSAETKLRPAGKTIRGTVSLGPKLNSKPPGSAVLFIIARSSGSSGPPLAVKKIEGPAFPIRYILGPEDSMIPGRALAGKVFVSARLDQDGNPTTRGAGDWVGEYGKNPVEVGTEGVDITLQRLGEP